MRNSIGMPRDGLGKTSDSIIVRVGASPAVEMIDSGLELNAP